MADVPMPAGRVREAADRLKTALDEHLAAVEARSGESDPAVYTAFRRFRDTLAAYDVLLYDAYDEVAPYVVVEPVPADAEGVEVDEAAELVVSAADDIPEAVVHYVAALEHGDDADEAEQEVNRALGVLFAAVEDAYGRRLRPAEPVEG